MILVYAEIQMIKDAIEAVGTDRAKVAEALRKTDSTNGAAKFLPGARYNE